MKAYRIYTTVFVVNDQNWLVVQVQCSHAEQAVETVNRLNREFERDSKSI